MNISIVCTVLALSLLWTAASTQAGEAQKTTKSDLMRNFDIGAFECRLIRLLWNAVNSLHNPESGGRSRHGFG